MADPTTPPAKHPLQIDWLTFSLITVLILFILIMFFVFRSQSKKSSYPEALTSNASDPTPLNHAPSGTHSEYSASLLSLGMKKPPTLELRGGEVGDRDKDRAAPQFQRRLFWEDTRDMEGMSPRRGSQAV